MTIKKENGKIMVKSDYNKSFIEGAKKLGGRWSSPYWAVPEANEAELRELCLSVYGQYDGEAPAETVALILDVNAMYYTSELLIGGTPILRRAGRDIPVRLSWEDAAIISGGFKGSGGSMKNPNLAPLEGTKVRVNNFPKMVIDRLDDLDGIEIIDSKVDGDALKAEREKLMARIAEIDELLK